jgi:hypothetical protein
VLTADVPEVDLSVMVLPRWNSIMAMTKASQANGMFGDYTKLYGQKPPAWHVTEARGVSKEVQLSDFKGNVPWATA